MKQSVLILLFAVAACLSLNVQAVSMYKWVDKDGKVHYSQRKPASSNYERLKIKTTPARSSPAETTNSEPSTSADSTSKKSGGRKALKNAVAKNEELRTQNCAAAKKNLQAYTVYRRIRMPDGSVKRLADDERARLIAESKASIKEFCDE